MYGKYRTRCALQHYRRAKVVIEYYNTLLKLKSAHERYCITFLMTKRWNVSAKRGILNHAQTAARENPAVRVWNMRKSYARRVKCNLHTIACSSRVKRAKWLPYITYTSQLCTDDTAGTTSLRCGSIELTMSDTGMAIDFAGPRAIMQQLIMIVLNINIQHIII